MAKKAKTPQELLYSYEEKILDSRKRWDYLKKNGGSSPFYADGCDLNLVRNHMIYYQHLMEEICRENKLSLPDSFYIDLPPLMDDSYMVRSEEIRVHAKESLSLYMADENYLFIKNTLMMWMRKRAKPSVFRQCWDMSEGLLPRSRKTI